MKKILKIVTVAAMGIAFTATAHAEGHAEGDVAKGEKVFKKCKSCHQIGNYPAKKTGPNLDNIVGAKAASKADFPKYSKTLKEMAEKGLVWTEENLDKFLKKPKKFEFAGIKGKKIKMSFPGLKKEEDRKNIIAFLKSHTKTEAK